LLDIGCGKGFDGDLRLQASLADTAREYIGIEPDPEIPLAPFFTSSHRCLFEEAAIPGNSIDVAFAVMVLEHLSSPQAFWDKLRLVLRQGGVFWGFTMDARHWFVRASRLAQRLKVKDWYLNRLHGNRGEERYENYPVHYRSNTPAQFEQLAASFRSCTVFTLGRVGQLDYYFPKGFKWVGRGIDRLDRWRKKPGSLLAVRVVK
jgi:SAM-dependent methyltransferase